MPKKLFELGLKSHWFERSKSGMMHLWLFFSEPVAARKVRRILQFVSRELKLKIANGIVEIFPKQDELSNEGVGNYMNLPYFYALNGHPLERRVMLDPDTFEPISLENFLDRVNQSLASPPKIDIVFDSLPKEEHSQLWETSSQHSTLSDAAWQIKKEKIIESLRKYWTQGQRQDISMCLAGFFAKKQRLPWPETANLILEIAALCDDSEAEQRIEAIKATYEKVQKGQVVKGYRGLEEILSLEDLQTLTGLFNDDIFEPIPVPKYQVLPFPVEVFPKSMQKILNEYSKAVHCPMDFFGVPLLVEAGAAIGTSRTIAIKPGWLEGPRINGAVVSDPGSRKSPALNLAMSPIYKIQMRMQSQYTEEKELYENELKRYESELKEWRKSEGDDQKPDEPEPPIMKQIFTTDSTLEALAELLEQNPRGLLFARDELTGWVQSMNQYRGGKGADRQAWLSFWNGSPVIVNRKNRKEPIALNNPLVGVVGCLPPDVLGDLADERGREDGFIHRLLFSYPDNVPLEWVEDEITQDSLDTLDLIFERLMKLEPKYDENGNPKSVVVSFTPEGKEAWRDFINDHYKEQEDPLFSDNLRGPWAKMEGYAARLALILHLLRYACKEVESEQVDEISMAGAADLVDYFKSYTKRVYTQLRVSPEDKKALGALMWIRRQGGEATARDVLTYRVANVRTASEAKQLLRQLQERGHGTIKEGARGNIAFTLAA